MGISEIIPLNFTIVPGLLLLSERGETKSSLRKTFILFGCAPSRSSAASSKIIPWPSTSSLAISLNFPFLPQPHLVGSVTWGRTSDFCLTIPSHQTNLERCLLLISEILILCESGRLLSLIVNFLTFFGRSNSLMEISAALSSSSGCSKISSASSVLNLINSAKSRTRNSSPFRTVSSNCG